MNQFHAISLTSLCLASALVVISMVMSYRQELKLEKDIFISALRATIQLLVIGFVLSYIFGTENPVFTVVLLGCMDYVINLIINRCTRVYGLSNDSCRRYGYKWCYGCYWFMLSSIII